MTTDAVIFDIGNVLITWDPKPVFTRALGSERARQALREIPFATMNDCVDLGAPFRQSVEALARAYPDQSDVVLLWRDHWLEMASPAIDHSVRLLQALRARGVPVYALSNFGIETLEMADAAYPFLTEFDARFVSGHMRCVKPDPEIYARLEQEIGCSPNTLLFTDDLPENIAVAEARGWQTHLFTTGGGWAQRLVAAGLLSESEAM